MVVVNTLPQRTHFVWSLYQFVDSAVLFLQPEGRGPLYRVGQASRRVVASQRPFPARSLCLLFWLDTHAQAVGYLRVESYSTAWNPPTDMSTVEGFLAFETTYFACKHWARLLGLHVGSVLLDPYLPLPLDGLTLLPQLRRQWPTLRVLVYSSAASPVLVSQVAAAGAYGFLDKSAEAVALLAAIRAVHTGQLVFPARLRLPVLPSAASTGSPLRHSGRRCAAAPAAAFGPQAPSRGPDSN